MLSVLCSLFSWVWSKRGGSFYVDLVHNIYQKYKFQFERNLFSVCYFFSLPLVLLAFTFIYVLFLPEVFKKHNKDFDCYSLDRLSVAKFLPFLMGWGKFQLSSTKTLCGKVTIGNDEGCACPSSLFVKRYFVLLSFCKVESYFCLKTFVFSQTLCVLWNSLFF